MNTKQKRLEATDGYNVMKIFERLNDSMLNSRFGNRYGTTVCAKSTKCSFIILGTRILPIENYSSLADSPPHPTPKVKFISDSAKLQSCVRFRDCNCFGCLEFEQSKQNTIEIFFGISGLDKFQD